MKTNKLYSRSFTALILMFVLSSQSHAQTDTSWKVKKTEWTDLDEKEYSEFVSRIGEAVEKRECNSFQSCLRHPNNPYRGSDTTQLKVFADCAKLSYVMRGYFAWKKGLPFGFVNDVNLRQVEGNSGDKRYSKFGNEVAGRASLIPKMTSDGSVKFQNAVVALNQTIPEGVYSANFRINFEGIDDDKLFTDFYPVELSRQAIVPGTNIYDPNGHVAIVYKVTDDGKIYFIDAHPDNSLTSGLYGTKFVRSLPGQGAGFKNFRPLRLEGSQFNSTVDSYVGGVLKPAKDKNLSLHSLTQFFGTNLSLADWKKSVFQIDGVTYSYYDYLRIKMSKGILRLDPVREVKSLASDLCQTVQDRVEAVDSALKTGVQNKNHPDQLPLNIYGTSGEWESYSTPSRDARLKTTFTELRGLVENLYNLYMQRDPRVVYQGNNIKQDMLNSYMSVVKSCSIQYTKSNGIKMPLTLEEVRIRLFRLSFDPYHCAELRWGAQSSDEMLSCADNSIKQQWYLAEQRLRNQIERKYDARMDFKLSDLLLGKANGTGVDTAPDVDIMNYLTH